MRYINNFSDYEEIIKSLPPVLAILPETVSISAPTKRLENLGIPFILKKYNSPDLLKTYEKVKDKICGIIIHGGPLKKEKQLFSIPTEILNSKKPKLGICLGLEVIGIHLGSSLTEVIGTDENPPEGFSVADCKLFPCDLFLGIGDLPGIYSVPFSHKYKLKYTPLESTIIASSIETPIAGFHHQKTNSYCIQFGIQGTFLGDKILSNFYDIICKGRKKETK